MEQLTTSGQTAYEEGWTDGHDAKPIEDAKVRRQDRIDYLRGYARGSIARTKEKMK